MTEGVRPQILQVLFGPYRLRFTTALLQHPDGLAELADLVLPYAIRLALPCLSDRV